MRSIVELIIRSIHLISAIIWFGGVFFHTFITIPLGKKNLLPNALLEIHNRFRQVMRVTINILLLTGGIVIFIIAWNNDMQLKSEYMVFSAIKLGAFGLMALSWGLYSSLFHRHLEGAHPEKKITVPKHTNIFGILTLLFGLIVFFLSMLLRN